jgi:hypothetical protein
MAATRVHKDRIIDIDDAQLSEMVKRALQQTTPDKGDIARLMSAMVARAEDLWRKERRNRDRWNWANWMLGGLGAGFAAVAGGGVLAGVAGAARYVLGFVTLLGAALGAVAASLQTARHGQLASFKAKRYETFARDTTHFLVTSMPGATPDGAAAQLHLMSKLLDEIESEGVTLPEDRVIESTPDHEDGTASRQSTRSKETHNHPR